MQAVSFSSEVSDGAAATFFHTQGLVDFTWLFDISEGALKSIGPTKHVYGTKWLDSRAMEATLIEIDNQGTLGLVSYRNSAESDNTACAECVDLWTLSEGEYGYGKSLRHFSAYWSGASEEPIRYVDNIRVSRPAVQRYALRLIDGSGFDEKDVKDMTVTWNDSVVATDQIFAEGTKRVASIPVPVLVDNVLEVDVSGGEVAIFLEPLGACAERERVRPILQCVGEGEYGKFARFGYHNPNDCDVYLPIGEVNRLGERDTEHDAVQPELFLGGGMYEGVRDVTFRGRDELVWHLEGQAVRATPAAGPVCPPEEPEQP